MGKKCIICNSNAIYKIKDTSDYYCADCAEENFSDTSILVKVEDEAKRLKAFVDSQMDGTIPEEEEEEEEEDKELQKEKKKSKNVSDD